MSELDGNGVVALVRRTSNVMADKPVRSIGLSAFVMSWTPPCC